MPRNNFCLLCVLCLSQSFNALQSIPPGDEEHGQTIGDLTASEICSVFLHPSFNSVVFMSMREVLCILLFSRRVPVFPRIGLSGDIAHPSSNLLIADSLRGCRCGSHSRLIPHQPFQIFLAYSATAVTSFQGSCHPFDRSELQKPTLLIHLFFPIFFSLPREGRSRPRGTTLKLPALTRLDLAHNRFVVPPELTYLPQLAELHLGYEQAPPHPPRHKEKSTQHKEWCLIGGQSQWHEAPELAISSPAGDIHPSFFFPW